MKYIERFYEWNHPMYTSSSSVGDVSPKYQYTSTDKIYYGVHQVTVSNDKGSVEVKAKFDTGARSSSIDFAVAKKLGMSDKLIAKCKELSKLRIDKTINKKEQKRLEKQYTSRLKSRFPEISKVKMVKSSSGFSVRIFITLNIQYQGYTISNTEVNLRDRTGLSCEMLVGLKDML